MDRSVSYALLCTFMTFGAFAQSPGTLDTNYVTTTGTDATVNCIVPLAGNKVLASGYFTNYAGTGPGGLVRLNADGTVDTGFTVPKLLSVIDPVILNGTVLVPGSTNPASINAVLARPDGKAVFVGQVTHVGTQKLSSKGIGLVETNGSPAAFTAATDKLEPGSLLNAPGNTIYVGGKGTVDNGSRLAMLRLNADGSRDSTFTPPTLASLGYQGGNVVAMHRGPNDTIYAVVAAAIALKAQLELIRLNSDGTLDTTFADAGKGNCGTSLSTSFAPTPNGQIIVFNSSPGTLVYRGTALASSVTRLLLNGAIDETFAAPANLGVVAGGAVQADEKVLVLNSPLGAVARFNKNGSVDTGYLNPAKVPVNQLLFITLKIALAADGSTFVSVNSLSSTFKQIFGVFHVFGDPNSAPRIAAQPVTQTNTLGARTRFTVVATGAAPLSYQWFRGTEPIPGETGADLILKTTTALDEADYRCIVSNAMGATPSETVRLNLLPPSPGSVYRETDVPVGPDNSVAEIQWASDGSLLAVGSFIKWNTISRNGLVRLLPNSLDLDGFNPTAQNGNSGNPFNEVLALPSGQVFATGAADFSIAGKRYGALRFNQDGSLDPVLKGQAGYTALASGFRSTSAAIGPDGKVVLWASYWNDENVQGSHIRLNTDGTRDTTFALRGAAYAMNGGAVTALPDGRYLVAGKPNIHGTVSSGIMRLKSDGTLDPTFNPASTANSGEINQIIVLPSGRILLAGVFIYRANAPSPNLALGMMRLLPDGGTDPEFNPVPRLASPTPASELLFNALRRVVVLGDGRLVGVGSSSQGTFPRNQLFGFWPNGTLDPEFDVTTNIYASGSMNLLALAARPADNAIFIGGAFTEFSGLERTNFVRVNGGVNRLIPARPTIVNQPVRVVAKAGGTATLAIEPGGSGPFQFQWRRNEVQGSTNFVDIPGATNATLIVRNLRLVPQDSGLFQCAVVNPGGAVYSSSITLLVEPNPASPGQFDTSLNVPSFSGILTGQYQIAESNPDGSLYGSLGNTIVRFLEDGTPDITFRPPADLVPAGGGVAVLKRQPDGKLLVAGRLTDGAVARLLSDGQYDPAFVRTNNYTGNFQDVPEEMGLQSDGKILLAGTFSNFAGRPVNGLIRFLPDGRVDESFPLTTINDVVPNPSRTLPGRVAALRVLADDRIYIGGGFTQVQGVERQGLARLKPDGSLDTTFVPPTNGSVPGGTSGNMLFYQLGPVALDGGIYIFGEFRPSLNTPGTTALRLRADGSADSAFHLVTDFQINTGAVQPDGKLIINGQFGQVNGTAYGNFARVNPDGSLDSSWQPGSTVGGTGGQLTLLSDGKLLAGNRRVFLGTIAGLALPQVSFTLSGGALKLSWPAGYKLQRATQLLPPRWQDVTSPQPFVAPLTGPGEFFRVIVIP